jgi:glycosyltransferase involved in cell wall biosynthesis
MLRTIFLTASKGVEGKNFEHIMRIIFLSRYSNLTLLIASKADFCRYLSPGTKTARSPFAGKLGLVLFSTCWLIKHRNNLHNAIIITEPSVLGVVGYLAKLLTNVKWVVDVWDIPIRHHGSNSRLTLLRIKVTRILMKLAYRKADRFIVGIRPDFQFKYYQIPESKILLWPTTIWIPQKNEDILSDEDDKHFNILCMKSRHLASCGLDILIQAFLKIRKQIGNARLWIIGRIGADVKRSIQDFIDLEGVEFLGFLEHSKVLHLIRKAHLCVIPWRDDVDLAQAYPTKVMEYMTEGKVVLAARIAGISDMIEDGEDGLLHRPGDPDDLAEKILMLYRDRALRKRIAKNACNYHFKFDTICKHEEIFRMFQSLVKGTSFTDFHTVPDGLKNFEEGIEVWKSS